MEELDVGEARELEEAAGRLGTVQRAGKVAESAAVLREAVGERLEPIKVLVSELYEAREPPALSLRDAAIGSPVEPERMDDLAVEQAELGTAGRRGGS